MVFLFLSVSFFFRGMECESVEIDFYAKAPELKCGDTCMCEKKIKRNKKRNVNSKLSKLKTILENYPDSQKKFKLPPCLFRK